MLVASNLKATGQNCSTQAKAGRVRVTSCSCFSIVDKLLAMKVDIIHYCQQMRFSEETAALSSSKATVSNQIAIYKLDPVLVDGLLRA